jgi:two-component system sensor histidine kinase/response regulator
LIVDDNSKNIQLLASVLTNNNYEIEYALNGEKALEWLKEITFDLILLDIMMPEMDGFETCRKIKEIPAKNEIPIIFLTANTDIESVTNAFDIGGVDYITKPFNEKELLARVKTHLELKDNKDKLKKVNIWLEEQVALKTEELQVAYQELQEAFQELEQLDVAKDEFLKILSHEIRTPLNGIVGPLQLLKIRIDDENIIRLLQMLEVAVKRLEKFSYDALLITTLKTQKHKTTLTDVDTYKLLEYNLLGFNEQISEKNLKINLDNFQHDLTIKTDSDLFSESLKRVIDNAIVFSDENSEITISSDQSKEQCTITITDEGKGFKESILNQELSLFNPGEGHIDQNVGIDLYLVNLIMQTLNGKLVYGNNKDQGAYVKLYFQIIE